MTITANWSYPTAIKFGAGRISELADHCKAVGMKKPLLVTDRGLSTMPITKNALDVLEGVDGIARVFLTYKDVVRHEMVQKIITAYDKYEHRSRD